MIDYCPHPAEREEIEPDGFVTVYPPRSETLELFCPFEHRKPARLAFGTASTGGARFGHYLACPDCGFSLTARTPDALLRAHGTLMDYLPLGPAPAPEPAP